MSNHLAIAPDGNWRYCQLTPRQVEYLRAQGWEIIESETVNTIPAWASRFARVWCWLQDHKWLPR